MSVLDGCPNDPPCPHLAALHDIYEPGDPYPTCCMEGCRCGHPGEAVLHRHDDNTVTVESADQVIRVSRELLDDLGPPTWCAETDTLTLDTAGEYVYRHLRPDPADPSRVLIFGQVKS